MTISVPLQDAFDIETYDGLKAFLIAHLELDSETQTFLPSLIRMAEYRLNRLLTTPWRETSETLTTTAALQYVALPADFSQAVSVLLTGDDGYPLEAVTLNTLHSQYPVSGQPCAYCISEQSMWFGPIPDAAYAIRLTYQARLAPLRTETQTNWLLSENADAYVYACLIQIESFLGNDERVPLYAAGLDQAIGEINAQGNRYRRSTPIRLRSPVVV